MILYNTMVNISKKRLDEKTAKEIHAQLFKTMFNLKSSKDTRMLVKEFFTAAEQVLFAKRLAALLLLAEHIPPYRVSRLLKLSSATTARFAREIEQEKHTHIVQIIKKKKDRDVFWAELEVMLRFGMPERGKNRWKWLDEMYPR